MEAAAQGARGTTPSRAKRAAKSEDAETDPEQRKRQLLRLMTRMVLLETSPPGPSASEPPGAVETSARVEELQEVHDRLASVCATTDCSSLLSLWERPGFCALIVKLLAVLLRSAEAAGCSSLACQYLRVASVTGDCLLPLTCGDLSGSHGSPSAVLRNRCGVAMALLRTDALHCLARLTALLPFGDTEEWARAHDVALMTAAKIVRFFLEAISDDGDTPQGWTLGRQTYLALHDSQLLQHMAHATVVAKPVNAPIMVGSVACAFFKFGHLARGPQPSVGELGLAGSCTQFILTAAVLDLLALYDGGSRHGLPESVQMLKKGSDGIPFVFHGWAEMVRMLTQGYESTRPASILSPKATYFLCLRVSECCVRFALGELPCNPPPDGDHAREGLHGGSSSSLPTKSLIASELVRKSCCIAALVALTAADKITQAAGVSGTILRDRSTNVRQSPSGSVPRSGVCEEPPLPVSHRAPGAPAAAHSAGPSLARADQTAALPLVGAVPAGGQVLATTEADITMSTIVSGQATQLDMAALESPARACGSRPALMRPERWWRAVCRALEAGAQVLSDPETGEMSLRAACDLVEAMMAKGPMAEELPARLPATPPPDIAAALAAGLVPSLEHLMRRVCAPQPTDTSHQQSVRQSRVTLVAGLFRWPQLGWLMGYGDERQVAALLATLGKLTCHYMTYVYGTAKLHQILKAGEDWAAAWQRVQQQGGPVAGPVAKVAAAGGGSSSGTSTGGLVGSGGGDPGKSGGDGDGDGDCSAGRRVLRLLAFALELWLPFCIQEATWVQVANRDFYMEDAFGTAGDTLHLLDLELQRWGHSAPVHEADKVGPAGEALWTTSERPAAALWRTSPCDVVHFLLLVAEGAARGLIPAHEVIALRRVAHQMLSYFTQATVLRMAHGFYQYTRAHGGAVSQIKGRDLARVLLAQHTHRDDRLQLEEPLRQLLKAVARGKNAKQMAGRYMKSPPPPRPVTSLAPGRLAGSFPHVPLPYVPAAEVRSCLAVCDNPRCSNLAGRSEADVVLKLCTFEGDDWDAAGCSGSGDTGTDGGEGGSSGGGSGSRCAAGVPNLVGHFCSQECRVMCQPSFV